MKFVIQQRTIEYQENNFSTKNNQILIPNTII